MKSVTLVLLTTLGYLVLLSCSGTETKNEEKNAENPGASEMVQAELIEVEIPVNGMTCTSCTQSVEATVNKIAGISGCKADFKEGNAVVKYDAAKTNVDEIVAVINEKTAFKAQKPDIKM